MTYKSANPHDMVDGSVRDDDEAAEIRLERRPLIWWNEATGIEHEGDNQQSFLIVGDRRSAPIHAFGEPVRSENRIGDYRPVNGVLFPFSFAEVEIGNEKN